MLTSKVAKRYAQGLLDFAQESEQVDAVFGEMKDIVKIMSESKELNQFFANPSIDFRKKVAAAQDIFKAFSPVSQNLIKLTITQGRESSIKGIAEEFINKVNAINGVQKISITTASELNQQTIQDILKSTDLVNANGKYELETLVKPDLLGGYILRVGDQQVDASVKTKLGKIKKDFQLN